MSLRRSDYDFELPDALIAQHPPAERSGGRLLLLPREGQLADWQIADLPSLLRAGDLLVFNDTRVLRARLFGTKETGGRVEMLVERLVDTHRAEVQIRASHAPKAGSTIQIEGHSSAVTALVTARTGAFHELTFSAPVHEVLETHGHLPLPPYIEHPADATDAERYQTVWAREPGAVAAPTAGLHFDQALLDRLGNAGVRTATLTLHVGAGTFLPVRVEDLSQHVMHEERYHVPRSLIDAVEATRVHGGRVVAVGTTSLRTLESAVDANGHLREGAGVTRLFITPGFRFRVVDQLLTNFHLPQSTLLMLVSAFAGMERIRAAYRHAIDARYRFFSYGDAMLIEPGAEARA